MQGGLPSALAWLRRALAAGDGRPLQAASLFSSSLLLPAALASAPSLAPSNPLQVEQLLAKGKRQRDTEATTMNMQLVTWRDGRAVNDAMAVGTGDALRTWRQP